MPTAQLVSVAKANLKRAHPSQPTPLQVKQKFPVSDIFVDPNGKPYKFYIKDLFPDWDEGTRKQLKDRILVRTYTSLSTHYPRIRLFLLFSARKTEGKSLTKSLVRVSLSSIPLMNGEATLVYPIRYYKSVTTLSASRAAGSSTGNSFMTPSGLDDWKNGCFESVGSQL